MKLTTPITGTVIEVSDEKAAKFIERGFSAVPQAKKPARKRTTKKEQ